MKKLFYRNTASLLVVLCLVTMCFTGCKQKTNVDYSKIVVYTSMYPMYDFVCKIGGDKVSVENLVPAGTEPHDWEPDTNDIVNLEKADMLVYNGMGMETWVDKVTDSLSNDKLVKVEASDGVNKIESDGSVDPHVWLSISNAKIEMNNIKEALIKIDPDNKDYYEANYEKYAEEFDQLDSEYKEKLADVKNKDIIVAHEAFGYLCNDYGLNQVPIEGLSADSEPDPDRMTEIVKFAKENNVKTIFFEELVSSKVADTIANEVGATTEVLNPIEGLSKEDIDSGEDYLSVMRRNLDTLVETLNQ